MDSTAFETQFGKREYISSPLGEIETLDITPSNLITKIPVLFAPGFRETPELQKECLREVYNSGRRVITLFHPQKLQKLEATVGDFPEVELQKAKTLLMVLEAKKLPRVDVISHSEGAINVSIAATIEPRRFRNLILVAPAGLVGRDSLIRVATGFMKHIYGTKSFWRFVKVGVRRTKERISLTRNISYAIKEGLAIAAFNIHPLLLELKNGGIKVAILAGEKDQVFPLSRIKTQLEKVAKPPHYGFNIFATKPSGHEIYSKPKEVMPQVLGLLTQLE